MITRPKAVIMTVQDLAARIEGRVLGAPDRPISGVASPEQAGSHDLIFVESARSIAALERSGAGAAIVPSGVEPPGHMSGVVVGQPAIAMARAIDLFVPPRRDVHGVSPHAVLGRHVRLGSDVGVAPFVAIGDDVVIGRGTEIHSGVTIGAGTIVGDDCIIYSGVHIYHDTIIGNRVILHSGVVIGADGFGFVREPLPDSAPDEPLRHRKVRQVGCVVIEDDVEIGANSAVDRAMLHETRIGRGTKIDNLVTLGHNCRIGRHCIIVGQAGISGSTRLGDYVTVAGQAGLTGHLRIGARAVIGSQAGVTKDVPEGGVVLGSPAIEVHRAKKALSLLRRLPEFMKTLGRHERRITKLEHVKVESPADDADSA